MAVIPPARARLAADRRFIRRGAAALALAAAAGCSPTGGFDVDLRDNLGTAFDTSGAVSRSVSARPMPDARGVISYPTYQVAVARRGDTVADVAARVGLPVAELAGYNGMPMGVPLRRGEVLALPRRVAEPSPATGAPAAGPAGILSAPATVTSGKIDVGSVAASAIDRAQPQQAVPGEEPRRHKVRRGETAYQIARLYDVPVQALGEWNGLGPDLSVREGQYLLIPVARAAAPRPARPEQPGEGSVAPIPPSAAEPLPDEQATTAIPEETPPSPDMGAQATEAASAGARMSYPVSGSIVRAFRKGTNDGIDIAAPAGTPVRAAEAGTVAAITRDTDQVPIVVLRHAGDLLTVYAGVGEVSVSKGDQVGRGQPIATIRSGPSPVLHFEVREGFDSVDPVPYLE